MATTPLFFSSSPPTAQADHELDRQVDEAFDEAQQVTAIEPELQDVFTQNRASITTFLTRRLELINSRSRNWSDGQITIFDKVLVRLTRNGEDLNSPAVVTYFCREFLGIFDGLHLDEKSMILSDSVVASSGAQATPAVSPSKSLRDSVSEAFRQENISQKELVIRERSSISEEEDPLIADLVSNLEPITDRLWQVYTHAKVEFAQSQGLGKQESARFLRDTAENLLHRLQAISADVRLINAVGRTLQVATVEASTYFGGRKRKFEQNRYNSGYSRTKAPRYERSRETKNSFRDGRKPKTHRELFPLHTKSIDRYRPQAPRLDSYRPDQPEQSDRNGRPDLSSKAGNYEQGRGRHQNGGQDCSNGRLPEMRMPGRGHSGIPFGYSRPVDSYCPE